MIITTPDGRKEIVKGKNVTKRVEQELGLDGDAMLNSCFVEQKNLDKLENSEASKRRDTIAKLMNLEKFTAIEKEFKEQFRDLQDQISISKEKIRLAEIESEIPKKQRLLGNINHKLDLIDLQKKLNDLSKEITVLNKRINEIDKEITNISSQIEEINKIEENIPKKEQRLEMLRNLFKYLGYIRKKEQDQSDLKQRLNSEKGSLEKLEKLEHQVAERQKNLMQLEEEQKSLTKKYDCLSELVKLCEKLRGKNKLLETIESIKYKIKIKSESITTLEQKLKNAEEENNALQHKIDLLSQRAKILDLIKEIQTQIDSNKHSIEFEKNKLDNLKNIKHDIERREKSIEELQKNKSEIQQTLDLLEPIKISFEKLDVLKNWIRIKYTQDQLYILTEQEHKIKNDHQKIIQQQKEIKEKISSVKKTSKKYLITTTTIVFGSIALAILLFPLTAIGILAAGIPLYLYRKNIHIQKSLNEKNQNLQNQINEKEVELAKIEGKKEDVKEKGGKDNVALNRLENILKNYGILDLTINKCDDQITHLKHDTEGFDKNELTNNINTAKQQLAGIEAKIQGEETEINNLKTKLNEKDVGAIESKIKQLTSENTEFYEKIGQYNQEIADIDEKLSPTTYTEYEEIKQKQKAIQDDIAIINANIESNQSEIKELTSELEKHNEIETKNKISEYEEQILIGLMQLNLWHIDFARTSIS